MEEGGRGERFDGKYEEGTEKIVENGFKPKSKKETTFGMDLKDPEVKEKLIYSMFMAAIFFSLGMYVGQIGTTFLDLQILTNSDLESATAFFTAGNAGYAAGSIVTGLIYNKMNKPFLVFICTFSLAVANILLPYCTQYTLMIFIKFTAGSLGGAVDTGVNSEHMRLWGSEADGLLQFLHFCFSFGGVISPLLAEPFLAEKDMLGQNDTASNLQQDIASTSYGLYNATSNVSLYTNGSLNANTTSAYFAQPLETRIHYVFMITGIWIAMTSIPFFVFFVKNRNDKRERKADVTRRFARKNVPLPMLLLMLSGVCVFYFIYCCIEDTFFSFLMTFLVGEYDSVSKSDGAIATAIAWSAFAVARFLMIFMTKIFTPIKLLFLMTTGMAVAFTAFSVFAYYGVINALFVFSAIAGLSLSGVFPSGFSWMESEMFPVTGIVSSCILVTSSMGSMSNPLLLGYLMEEYTNMWFCYLLLIEVFVASFLLVILLIFTRCFIDRKYGKLNRPEIEQEIKQSQPTDESENNDDEMQVTFITH